MDSTIMLEYQWPCLLALLPAEARLEETASAMGALRRKRGVDSASSLLRLCLAYGFCGMTLRQTAAWAQVAQVANLSNVALLKRLRAAGPWLGWLVGVKLAERASPPPVTTHRLRLFDATTVSRPGSTGTDWRIHLGFDAARLAIDDIELTDASGGESLTRFGLMPGQVAVADRGYAHRRGLHSVRAQGADFIVRINWQNLPLTDRASTPFDLFAFLRGLAETVPAGQDVLVAACERDHLPALPARLVAMRKSEPAAETTRRKILQEAAKKGRTVDPRTLEAAAYVMVLTSLLAETVPHVEVLDVYRFRWQIELAFKRLKSLLCLDHLPARDPPLARAFLYAKLLAALLLDDFTDRFLAFSPWGFRLAFPSAVSVAHPARAP